MFKDKVQYVYTAVENEVSTNVKVPWSDLVSSSPAPIRNVEHLFSKQAFRVGVTNDGEFGGGFQSESEDLSPEEKICHDSLSDQFLKRWAISSDSSRTFCKNKPQQIACFDSTQKQRFCVFDNNLMDFSKMSVTTDSSKVASRTFAPGFLQSSCNDDELVNGPDRVRVGLGQVPVITNDLSGQVCDVVFNEPVLLYSHSNSFKFPMFLEDSLNIMSILYSLQILENVRDITLLNVDNLVPNGKLNDDKISSFFTMYKFRRVVSASSLSGKKVCFKKLISPTFPTIPFVHRLPKNCTENFISPILQRWNVMTRHFRNGLNVFKTKKFESYNPNHIIQVTLLYQSTSNQKNSLSQLGNIASIADKIKRHFNKKVGDYNKNSLHYGVVVVPLDLDKSDFKTQVSIIANTSILVGIDGPTLAAGALLPIGSPACCGILEIFTDRRNPKTYLDFISKLGIHVRSVGVTSTKADLSVKPIVGEITELIKLIHKKNSCIDPNIAKDPFKI